MLRAVRTMLHGELPEKWANVTDAPHLWRKAPFILLLAALMLFGCFPRLLTDKISPSAGVIVQMANPVLEGNLRAEAAPAPPKSALAQGGREVVQ
jgi:NADH-quinone oxidoreductase subunit M